GGGGRGGDGDGGCEPGDGLRRGRRGPRPVHGRRHRGGRGEPGADLHGAPTRADAAVPPVGPGAEVARSPALIAWARAARSWEAATRSPPAMTKGSWPPRPAPRVMTSGAGERSLTRSERSYYSLGMPNGAETRRTILG